MWEAQVLYKESPNNIKSKVIDVLIGASYVHYHALKDLLQIATAIIKLVFAVKLELMLLQLLPDQCKQVLQMSRTSGFLSDQDFSFVVIISRVRTLHTHTPRRLI